MNEASVQLFNCPLHGTKGTYWWSFILTVMFVIQLFHIFHAYQVRFTCDALPPCGVMVQTHIDS